MADALIISGASSVQCGIAKESIGDRNTDEQSIIQIFQSERFAFAPAGILDARDDNLSSKAKASGLSSLPVSK